MREVVSSAADAKLEALFHNSKEGFPLQIALEELGHPQSPSVLITENSTASGTANDTVKEHLSKGINKCFYWIRDRIQQGHFTVMEKGRAKISGLFHKTSSTTDTTLQSAPLTILI
jgi:hypothetical protein